MLYAAGALNHPGVSIGIVDQGKSTPAALSTAQEVMKAPWTQSVVFW
jgi:hypothetical protein